MNKEFAIEMKVAPALRSNSNDVHLEGLSGRNPGVAEWKATKRRSTINADGHRRDRRKSVNCLEDLNDVLKRTVINKCYYPMYAVRIQDFLKFKTSDNLEHQHLLRRNLLTMWSPGKGPCAFISHQWTSWAHADPEFDQLSVLKSFITRILHGSHTAGLSLGWKSEIAFAGVKEVHGISGDELKYWAEHGYIWFDYFCVPQNIKIGEGEDEGGERGGKEKERAEEAQNVEREEDENANEGKGGANGDGKDKEQRAEQGKEQRRQRAQAAQLESRSNPAANARAAAAAAGKKIAKARDSPGWVHGHSLLSRGSLEQNRLSHRSSRQSQVMEAPQSFGGYYYAENAQMDLKNAVDSIPAYVECSSLFIILCPPCLHKNSKRKNGKEGFMVNDFGSWRRRGWCRAEAIARLLSAHSGPMIKLISAVRDPELVPPFEAWLFQCGHGEFTCCERNHRFETPDGKTITVPCDKETIGDVVMKMIDRQVAGLYSNISKLRNTGMQSTAKQQDSLKASLFRFRWLIAFRSYMLAGLLRQAKRDAITYDAFMKLYQFEGPTDTSTEPGWSPLRYACLHDSGRSTELVEALLNEGADPELPLFR